MKQFFMNGGTEIEMNKLKLILENYLVHFKNNNVFVL